jgi:hypothetical protein
VKQLLETDARMEFAFTDNFPSLAVGVGREIAEKLSLTAINFLQARTRNWDLIVFADHNRACRFAPHIPKLQVYHSLTGGKIIDGENFRFGAQQTAHHNQPIYKLMLVPSEKMKRRALTINPRLGKSIAVVGDPFVDTLCSMNAKRETIRAELGFSPDDTVILLQSTFGEHSLIESMGVGILEATQSLLREYKFVLSTHPAHWSGPHFKKSIHDLITGQRGQGITVMEPGDSWERYAIASDACLSDHSGLVYNYALLGKPLAMIKLPDGLIGEAAEESIIYDAVPHLHSCSELPELLDALTRNFSSKKLAQTTSILVSYPGRAHELIRHHLYELLKCSPPGTALSPPH